MEHIHYNKIKQSLVKHDLQNNIFEIHKEGKEGESLEASIQVSPGANQEEGHIWFSYSLDQDIIQLLSEAEISVPKEFTLGVCERGEYCIFDLSFAIEDIEEIIALFLSQLLDVFYGKPNQTIQIDVEGLGSDNGPFDHTLANLYRDAGISCFDFDIFSEPEKINSLKMAADTELFKNIKSLKEKIDVVNNDDKYSGWDDYLLANREKAKENLPLYKKRFYMLCEFYAEHLFDYLLPDNGEPTWEYYAIKHHFDNWLIPEYLEMVNHYRSTMKRPEAYEYLDQRLDDLKRVIQKVHEVPGIDRAKIYSLLKLNGRSYGSIITSVLVANNVIREEQVRSKKILYPVNK
tara:strand:- start:1466 stop:2506 length:1041 start_codon:yes stop_codon:yes gene_type:complete